MSDHDKRAEHGGRLCKTTHAGISHRAWQAQQRAAKARVAKDVTPALVPDPMPPPAMTAAQVAAIAEVLNAHGVKYVVIGGMAAQLQGVPVPATRDTDITPSAAPDNIDRLVSALREMNARIHVGGNTGVEIPLDARLLASMINIQTITDHGPLDINFRPDGTSGYDDLREDAVVLDVEGQRVTVTAAADILRSKQAAGRTKDLAVIPKFLRWLSDHGR